MTMLLSSILYQNAWRSSLKMTFLYITTLCTVTGAPASTNVNGLSTILPPTFLFLLNENPMVQTMVNQNGDGEASVIKRTADRAVITRKVVIRSAEELYSFCKDTLTVTGNNGQRDFVYIDSIDRSKSVPSLRPVKGARQLHQVRSSGEPDVILIRALSCHCHSCLLFRYDECMNLDHVRPFKAVKLLLVGGQKKVGPAPLITPKNNCNIPEVCLPNLRDSLLLSRAMTPSTKIGLSPPVVHLQPSKVSLPPSQPPLQLQKLPLQPRVMFPPTQFQKMIRFRSLSNIHSSFLICRLQ